MKIFSSKKKALKHAHRRGRVISEKNGKFIVKDNKLVADIILYIIVILVSIWLIWF